MARGLDSDDAEVLRILVCGDSRTGKTTFVNVLCGEYNLLDAEATREKIRRSAQGSTVGCNVNVRVHRPVGRRVNTGGGQVYDTSVCSRTNAKKTSSARIPQRGGHGGFASDGAASLDTIVEVIDVGGAKQYALARPVFYDRVHAIILVHDLTNPKSLHSLRNWLQEITIADQKKIRYGGISARHQLSSTAGISSAAYSDGDIATASNGWLPRESARKRMDNAELNDAQRSLIQRVPILVLGNKLDLLSKRQQQKCFMPNFIRHVTSSVFAPNTEMESVQMACCSSHLAAEEAQPYRDNGGHLGHVLRFIDGVIAGGGSNIA